VETLGSEGRVACWWERATSDNRIRRTAVIGVHCQSAHPSCSHVRASRSSTPRTGTAGVALPRFAGANGAPMATQQNIASSHTFPHTPRVLSIRRAPPPPSRITVGNSRAVAVLAHADSADARGCVRRVQDGNVWARSPEFPA
jgi:hypothetical protein